MNIAFLGAGRMGAAMARNLLRAGHSVTVYNRDRTRAEALLPDGARVGATPAEACTGCEAAISMLSDDRAVEEVVFGPGGAAGALSAGSAHISCSTVSTAIARKLAAEHSQRGQGFLSAPVFGRPETAESRKLVVVAAGPAELLERFRPVLDSMGRETVHVGTEAWQANAVKLCGNFMIASMMEAFAEAFATLRKAGVDLNAFQTAINSLFASPVYANYARIIAEEKFEPAAFPLPLGLKDVRLLLETSAECQAPMPFAGIIRDRLLASMARGQSDLDWTCMTRIAALEAGL
jgi:3-hydroxyisobutyrate dehydrogenase-like beta-hydroxyacid dehydrogenase